MASLTRLRRDEQALPFELGHTRDSAYMVQVAVPQATGPRMIDTVYVHARFNSYDRDLYHDGKKIGTVSEEQYGRGFRSIGWTFPQSRFVFRELADAVAVMGDMLINGVAEPDAVERQVLNGLRGFLRAK